MKPTAEDFRNVGFTDSAMFYPRDELAVRMLAAFNNYPVELLPDAMKYFPNASTAEAWKRVADAAIQFFSSQALTPSKEKVETAS